MKWKSRVNYCWTSICPSVINFYAVIFTASIAVYAILSQFDVLKSAVNCDFSRFLVPQRKNFQRADYRAKIFDVDIWRYISRNNGSSIISHDTANARCKCAPFHNAAAELDYSYESGNLRTHIAYCFLTFAEPRSSRVPLGFPLRSPRPVQSLQSNA